jgi:hypothetical protein
MSGRLAYTNPFVKRRADGPPIGQNTPATDNHVRLYIFFIACNLGYHPERNCKGQAYLVA